MSVEVVNLQGGGKKSPTRFTDSLLSPDQPLGIGTLWNMPQNLINPPFGNAYSGADAAAALNRGATGLAYTNPGGGGFTPILGATPLLIDWSVVLFNNQYAQIKTVSNGAGISRPGLCVFFDPNSTSLYNLILKAESSQFGLDRYNGLVAANLVVPSVATAYVIGDIIRIEADITTTPGTTILRLLKNGVVISTFNDNSVNRITQGMFGLFFAGSNPAITTIIRDFDGGKL